MLRYLSVPLAALLLVFAGVFHGIRTGRWSRSSELEAATARCKSFPLSIGQWEGEEAIPLTETEIKRAEISGYVTRQYTRSKRSRVHVLLLCGRPGPISAYTPEICFSAAG